MRAPRSEQLRREIVRGVSFGDIPVKEMKRKVILNKKEKALLNSLGEYTPSAKELDNYLTGDIVETKKFLKQLEEKGLVKRSKDNTYSTTNDGRKIQQMMNKLPTPIKPKPKKDYEEIHMKDISTLEEIGPKDISKLNLQEIKKTPTKTDLSVSPITANKLGFPAKYSTKDEVAFIRQAIKDEYKHHFGEPSKMSIKMSGGTAYGNVTAFGSGDSTDKGITPKEYFILKKLGFDPSIGGQGVMILSDNLDKVTKRIDDIQKNRTEVERDIDSEIKELKSLRSKAEVIIDNEAYANAEDWQRQKVRMIDKELTKLTSTKKKELVKKTVDRSKSITAGKNLYQEKYEPKKTHLALTKTMTDMQKRRLIKMCKDNNIDTRELDPSLKYDENQEIIDHMIELDEEQMRDQRAKVEQKIQHLEGTYYGGFSKKRIKERHIDEKSTEPTVITKEDLIRKRKKKQLEKWEDEPYISKIDVEDIDTKK
ncbi:MAG: hypothetical protein GPJ51_12020 [Candidatus Heimdallarchaeota archaeon]|nr:hypothetical protein [Candidatus Heimdallarchaeota archaeon]